MIYWLKKFHEKLIFYTQHIEHPIPFDKNKITDVSNYHLYRRFLKAYIPLKLFNQFHLEGKPQPNDRILWIFSGKNPIKGYKPIGDTLMDLSGRRLLENRTIDLLTFSNVTDLLRYDRYFRHIYSDIKLIDADDYDYILLTQYTPRAIRLKILHFKNKRFGGLFRFLNISNRFNQILYSLHSVNKLFCLCLDNREISTLARPFLDLGPCRLKQEISKENYLTICIGGMEAHKTYRGWAGLIKKIDADTDLSITSIYLLGSSNGEEEANFLVNQELKRIKVKSFVNKISIHDSGHIISNSKIHIGCDGGLMHVCHSTNTPSLSLFIRSANFNYRLTNAINCNVIESPSDDVNDIDPQNIFLKLKRVLLDK